MAVRCQPASRLHDPEPHVFFGPKIGAAPFAPHPTTSDSNEPGEWNKGAMIDGWQHTGGLRKQVCDPHSKGEWTWLLSILDYFRIVKVVYPGWMVGGSKLPHCRAAAIVAEVVEPDNVLRRCSRTALYPPEFARNINGPAKRRRKRRKWGINYLLAIYFSSPNDDHSTELTRMETPQTKQFIFQQFQHFQCCIRIGYLYLLHGWLYPSDDPLDSSVVPRLQNKPHTTLPLIKTRTISITRNGSVLIPCSYSPFWLFVVFQDIKEYQRTVS